MQGVENEASEKSDRPYFFKTLLGIRTEGQK